MIGSCNFQPAFIIKQKFSTSLATNNISRKFKLRGPERKGELTGHLTTEVGDAHPSIWVLLFLPYSPCNSKLQLFSVAPREKQSHIPLYNKPIVAVPHLPVTIPYASRGSLPYEFPAISPNFQAITVVSGLCLITHESEKCHVNRSHPELKSFKMEAEVVTEAIEDLKQDQIANILVDRIGKLFMGSSSVTVTMQQTARMLDL